MDLVRRALVDAADTVVIKVGTNVLTRASGQLDIEQIEHLVEQLAHWRATGRQVVLVSSGAIGAGIGQLNLPRRPKMLPALQAAAAVGQSHLLQTYDQCLRRHGLMAAQILLTAADFDDRVRYLNIRNTLRQLLQWNCLPIINENDTVSVAEIKFGDNDQLAALVTNLLGAPLLILLSVVDGLYPDASQLPPHDPPAPQPSNDVPESATLAGTVAPASPLDLVSPVVSRGIEPAPLDIVLDLNDQVLGLAGTSTSGLGTGGMRSKLRSVQIATQAGASVWIGNGRRPETLRRMLQAERIGTVFPARGACLPAWKRWLGYTARPRGAVRVDPGARLALVEQRRSLLPVGVQAVEGTFAPGDVVAIRDQQGVEFARGLINYSSGEAQQILGQPSRRLAEILPGCCYEEMIHRDHLVILGAE